jgi:hypothetical protein
VLKQVLAQIPSDLVGASLEALVNADQNDIMSEAEQEVIGEREPLMVSYAAAAGCEPDVLLICAEHARSTQDCNVSTVRGLLMCRRAAGEARRWDSRTYTDRTYALERIFAAK